jgi:hypothetical protein
MADFKSYWTVDVTPAGWYPKNRNEHAPDGAYRLVKRRG